MKPSDITFEENIFPDLQVFIASYNGKPIAVATVRNDQINTKAEGKTVYSAFTMAGNVMTEEEKAGHLERSKGAIVAYYKFYAPVIKGPRPSWEQVRWAAGTLAQNSAFIPSAIGYSEDCFASAYRECFTGKRMGRKKIIPPTEEQLEELEKARVILKRHFLEEEN